MIITDADKATVDDEFELRRALTVFGLTGEWHWPGPKPGESGCIIRLRLLRELGMLSPAAILYRVADDLAARKRPRDEAAA